MTEDDDKEVVAQACMSYADIIKELPYLTIESCKYNLKAFLFFYFLKIITIFFSIMLLLIKVPMYIKLVPFP